MKYRSIKDAGTELDKQVEVPKRVKRWWFQLEQGKVCVSVKYDGVGLLSSQKANLV
jgi:hypothetical protein